MYKRVLILTAVVCLFGASAQATPITFTATLSGPAESPPNASPGTGFATIILDTAAHTLFINATFSGLLGTTTASHIHTLTALPFTGTAGVATQVPAFTSFPMGVTSGSFSQTLNLLDLASYNPPFVTANGGTAASAEAALSLGILTGRSYLNIHTNMFPGGEIRGFLVTPEPGTMILLGTGISALVARRRRRNASGSTSQYSRTPCRGRLRLKDCRTQD